MKELIQTIVQSLVDHPEEVVVKESSGENIVTYTLSVHKDDVGKVIGKQGRIIHAIRTVVYAAASQQPKRVVLQIEDKG
jgi:uncharacterized protein